MKKILTLFLALFIGLQVNATTTTKIDKTATQKRLNNIAYVLVKKNNLPSGISVKLEENDEANAYATINKEIYVYTGMLNVATTDEELAAIMAHEMGHILNGHNAKQTILNSVIQSVASSAKPTTTAQAVGVVAAQEISKSKLSKKDELEADITAVDLLQNSGYNPLALISVLNKICGNYIDVISTHPSGEKRLQNAYDYIDYNYPQWIKKGYNTDSYRKANALISLNVKERNLSPKKVQKWKKEQVKLQQQKIKRMKKMLKSNNGWNSAYETILIMNSTPSSSTSSNSTNATTSTSSSSSSTSPEREK